MEHHRPVRRSAPRRRRRAARCPTRSKVPRREARSAAARGRSRAAVRRSRPLPRPPSEGARVSRPRRPAGRSSTFGQRREQRDVADALVRLARARRDEPRVVERVDHLRALARLVVDLLVRARREERREGVDDGQQPVARHSGRSRDHVLLGDPALDEAVRVGDLERARAAVRGQVGIEDDEVARAPPRARAAPRRTPRRRTPSRRPSAARDVPAPDSGSPSRPTGRVSASTGSSAGGSRPSAAHRSATLLELGDGARERLVAGRAGVPAVRATPVGERDRVLHEGDALALDRLGDERLRGVAPSRKRPKAARNAAWSWPSTVSTCHPNARSFASRSPSATISSVRLSDWTSLRSTTTQSLPRRSWAAACSASQFCPSCSSPSPVITTTRPSRPS